MDHSMLYWMGRWKNAAKEYGRNETEPYFWRPFTSVDEVGGSTSYDRVVALGICGESQAGGSHLWRAPVPPRKSDADAGDANRHKVPANFEAAWKLQRRMTGQTAVTCRTSEPRLWQPTCHCATALAGALWRWPCNADPQSFHNHAYYINA